MKVKDDQRLRGALLIELFGPDGLLKERRWVNNLVVTTGKVWMASRMKDGGQNQMSHMAVGTGVVAPVIADAGLGTEVARVPLDSQTVAANTITYVGTFPAGVGTGAITEAGIFNAGVAGVMLARTTFAVINKGGADYMQISWVVTQS
jgi:hypothetical protein